MSQTAKISIAVVVILIIIALAFFLMRPAGNAPSGAAAGQEAQQNLPAGVTNPQTGQPAPGSQGTSNSVTPPGNPTPIPAGASGQVIDPTQGAGSRPSANQPSGATQSSASGANSDASMNQDAAAIDSQMGGMDSDNASADQGMNSQ